MDLTLKCTDIKLPMDIHADVRVKLSLLQIVQRGLTGNQRKVSVFALIPESNFDLH